MNNTFPKSVPPFPLAAPLFSDFQLTNHRIWFDIETARPIPRALSFLRDYYGWGPKARRRQALSGTTFAETKGIVHSSHPSRHSRIDSGALWTARDTCAPGAAVLVAFT